MRFRAADRPTSPRGVQPAPSAGSAPRSRRPAQFAAEITISAVTEPPTTALRAVTWPLRGCGTGEATVAGEGRVGPRRKPTSRRLVTEEHFQPSPNSWLELEHVEDRDGSELARPGGEAGSTGQGIGLPVDDGTEVTRRSWIH